MPSVVENDFRDDRFDDLENLRRIDRLDIVMEYDVNSIAYHFIPTKDNGRVLIWHQGTSGFFANDENEGKVIYRLLKEGYSVMALSHPLRGPNNKPILPTSYGYIKLKGPHDLFALKSEKLSGLKFLYQPVAVAINYLVQNYEYRCHNMAGFSGGAMITVGYAAADTRICNSFAISGSYPAFISNNWDDYRLVALRRIANLLEIYVMAGFGPNRNHIQITNKFDSHIKLYGSSILLYKDKISKMISDLGAGNFIGIFG